MDRLKRVRHSLLFRFPRVGGVSVFSPPTLPMQLFYLPFQRIELVDSGALVCFSVEPQLFLRSLPDAEGAV